jgi:hypothetical protein
LIRQAEGQIAKKPSLFQKSGLFLQKLRDSLIVRVVGSGILLNTLEKIDGNSIEQEVQVSTQNPKKTCIFQWDFLQN